MHHLQNDSIITTSRTNTEKEEKKKKNFGFVTKSVGRIVLSAELLCYCANNNINYYVNSILESRYICDFSYVRNHKNSLNSIREFSLEVDDHLIRKF
jgi:hypothetical protein